MKIAVMGAGAVGCFYGGLLARAGHAVTLIGRPQHVEALRTRGLILELQDATHTVPVDASTDASAVAGAGLVLFCVKSTDTESAGAAIAPHLVPGAALMSLQNGVDNAARLARQLGREVIPTVVYVATGMAGPGHVKHHGRNELVIGPSPAAPALVDLFAQAGVPVQVSDNVAGALWAKLIVNCAYNALSAITQLPYGRIVQGPGIDDVMRDIVGECLAVARAEGVTVPGDVAEAVRRIGVSMPTQVSSTAQDVARGKRSEIEHLNGYVVRRGAAHGVATPVNRVLTSVVRLLEMRGRE